MRIEPAAPAYDERGTPVSRAYGDVYHSADSGPGQARHVFLGGNDLPARWAHARVFTILETGFGFGLNFLATWRAWLDDAARPQRLHFVSIEKHPFDRNALEDLHGRYPEFAPLAARLRDAWPSLVPGLHRLHFEDECVTLTLAFGDVTDVLPQLRLSADAIYLDGFAPRQNPAMWSPHVMKRLARLARAGTTLATWSSAGAVRDGLAAAGFEVEKRPGFGHKREMFSARYAPRWPVRGAVRPAAAAERHAIVVGAGLAGAAVTERLVRRGWRIDLVDRRAPSAAARDRLAGVFHPHVSADDCILSRLARNGYLYAVSRWRALERFGYALAWDRCGVLQLAGRTKPEAWMAQTLAALGYPQDYAQYVDRAKAESLCGCALHGGGWWFPGGGWMRPASLVDAQLAAAHAHAFTEAGVETIAHAEGTWRVMAADGRIVASAPVLVLANAHDAARLAPIGERVDRVRGQVTYVPVSEIAAPRTIIAGAGYVLPSIDGVVMTGSTYDRGDHARPDARAHEANVARLSHMLPRAPRALDAAALDGAVGFRCVAPDRLPLAGAVPDVQAAHACREDLSGAHLADLPRRPGLYCVSGFASRGLTWSALAGELVASVLEGEPLPLEGDLADAIDPARFVLRRLRTGMLSP